MSPISPTAQPMLLSRSTHDRPLNVQTSPDCDFSQVYYAASSSSSSDLASPVTPTFSAKGHFRISSSASSIDLSPQIMDSPISPTQAAHVNKPPKSMLPDVLEEPFNETLHEADNSDDESLFPDQFGLYNCLCDMPCEHQSSTEDFLFDGNLVSDYEVDYDLGFLSDGDDSRLSRKKKSGTESPFSGLTSRIGSRLPSMTRWKPSSRTRNPMLSPSTQISMESVVLSGAASSRSSSMSSPNPAGVERFNDPSVLATPALSFYESTESINMPTQADIDQAQREGSQLERQRGLATTPLLPPLMTSPLGPPPPHSALQSPTLPQSPVATEVHTPTSPHPHFSRPSLSAKPSISSFRMGMSGTDSPLPFPAMLQDSDEWSDRLGHANFTITPLPYEPEPVTLEALKQMRTDWDTARCNYTKHLVRTGENYGETSKIYALTEAKWAETEKSWRTKHDKLMEHIVAVSSTPSASRSRSRGRGRARASSGGVALLGRPPVDDVFAGMQWRRLEDGMPSAIPRLLDAEGKFPSRGDEDIVGPMQRDEVMLRTHSEERKGARFWKSLAEKVGLRV